MRGGTTTSLGAETRLGKSRFDRSAKKISNLSVFMTQAQFEAQTPSRFNKTPRINTVGRGRNSHFNMSDSYNWRVKKDPANLPHNRLPDIEPRIAISQSLQHRWLNQRNHSAARQGAFIQQRHSIAKNTIENYERKFKAEEARLKKVKQFDKATSDDHKYKFGKIKEKTQAVFGRQKD